MSRFTLNQFEAFLQGIDLDGYRTRFQKIKTVEMDLPRKIQALQTIYEQYWDNVSNLKKPLLFDDYYKIYYRTHQDDIKTFWDSTGFDRNCNCFQKGLKARIYRTWAALLTQIQGGYVAETVFGKGAVRMGTDLDHKNIDILVLNNDGTERLRIQTKKETHRPEIARMHKNIENVNGAIDIYYTVPDSKTYDNPYYKRSGKGYKVDDEKPFVKKFVKWHPETGILDRLDNGFVIFTKNAFLGLE